MKPDWSDAPEWANYLAMDSDGRWFWYQKKPRAEFGEWSDGGQVAKCSEHYRNYGKSLEERP